MNWVGGARSRVKQQGEKKLQKEFFERKRMANKVQRIKPSLSKMKAAVSQDLLFLRTNKTDHKPKRAPSKLAPKVLSLDSTKPGQSHPTRGYRDLELPMSPIGKPSTLDIMDTSAVHTERCDRIRDKSSWSGGCVPEPPRVSTQKIPHRTVLDSFGPPRLREDISLKADLPVASPGPSHITDRGGSHKESLFSPSYKEDSNKHGAIQKPNGRQDNSRQYDMDDIFFKQKELHSKYTTQASVFTQNNAVNERLPRASSFGAAHRGPGSRQPTIFTIAKGGGRFVKKPLEKNKFDFNKPRNIQDRKNPRNQIRGNNARYLEENEGDAMLELHYCDKPALETLGQLENQKVPEATIGFPWTSREPAARLESESEETRYKKIGNKTYVHDSETSNSMDFNESIFGPIQQKRKKELGKITRRPISLHRTVSKRAKVDLDESIFRPLMQMKKQRSQSLSSHCPSAAIASLDESVIGPLYRRRQNSKKDEVVNKGGLKNQYVNLFNSTRFEESVLGPITKERIKPIDQQSNAKEKIPSIDKDLEVSSDVFTAPPLDLNSTMYNESILGPLHTHPDREDSNGCSVVRGRGGNTRKKPSTFEMMMKQLEEPCKEPLEMQPAANSSVSLRQPAASGDRREISASTVTAVTGEFLKQSAPHESDNNTWPSSVNSEEGESLPAECHGIAALPRLEASLERDSFHQCPDVNTGAKSCFIELMSLEEDPNLLYDGHPRSQDCVLTGGNSEDPLGQICGTSQENQLRCVFDSSQELSAREQERRETKEIQHKNAFREVGVKGKQSCESVQSDVRLSDGKENLTADRDSSLSECFVTRASAVTQSNCTTSSVKEDAMTTMGCSSVNSCYTHIMIQDAQTKLSPVSVGCDEATVQHACSVDPIKIRCLQACSDVSGADRVAGENSRRDDSTNENMCLALEKHTNWSVSLLDSNGARRNRNEHYCIAHEQSSTDGDSVAKHYGLQHNNAARHGEDCVAPESIEMAIHDRWLPLASDYANEVYTRSLLDNNHPPTSETDILKDKLKQAENTLIWQQIMITVYEIDQRK